MRITRLRPYPEHGGYALDCVCGRHIFRYTHTALTAATTTHLKLDHKRRYLKGRIK